MNDYPNTKRTGGMIIAIIITVLCFLMPFIPMATYHSGRQSTTEGYSVNKIQNDLSGIADEFSDMDDYYGRYRSLPIKSLEEVASNCSKILVLIYVIDVIGIILFFVMLSKYNNHDREGFWNWASWTMSVYFALWIAIYFYLNASLSELNSFGEAVGLKNSSWGPHPLYVLTVLGILVAYFVERHCRTVAIRESYSYDEAEKKSKEEKRRKEQEAAASMATRKPAQSENKTPQPVSRPKSSFSSFSAISTPVKQTSKEDTSEPPKAVSEGSQPEMKQSVSTKFCMFCGTQIPVESKFCFQCGKEQKLI